MVHYLVEMFTEKQVETLLRANLLGSFPVLIERHSSLTLPGESLVQTASVACQMRFDLLSLTSLSKALKLVRK
jgi:hypothetical protein